MFITAVCFLFSVKSKNTSHHVRSDEQFVKTIHDLRYSDYFALGLFS